VHVPVVLKGAWVKGPEGQAMLQFFLAAMSGPYKTLLNTDGSSFKCESSQSGFESSSILDLERKQSNITCCQLRPALASRFKAKARHRDAHTSIRNITLSLYSEADPLGTNSDPLSSSSSAAIGLSSISSG